MDYRWLAAQHGGKACFNCGVDTVKVRFGAPEEIAADVRECMSALGPTRRFILGTSDSITEKVPDANMRAFFHTAREEGTRLARQMYG